MFAQIFLQIFRFFVVLLDFAEHVQFAFKIKRIDVHHFFQTEAVTFIFQFFVFLFIFGNSGAAAVKFLALFFVFAVFFAVCQILFKGFIRQIIGKSGAGKKLADGVQFYGNKKVVRVFDGVNNEVFRHVARHALRLFVVGVFFGKFINVCRGENRVFLVRHFLKKVTQTARFSLKIIVFAEVFVAQSVVLAVLRVGVNSVSQIFLQISIIRIFLE